MPSMQLSMLMALISCGAFAVEPPDCTAETCAFRSSSMLQGLNKSGVKFEGVEEEEIGVKGLIFDLQRVKATDMGEDGPSFYIGHITVGSPPQRMRMLFDTASGNVLLPHRKCKSVACKEHNQYSTWHSNTAEDIFRNGSRISKSQRKLVGAVFRETAYFNYTNADAGEGQVVGAEVRDRVCLADAERNKVCANSGILAGIQMDDVPFRKMPNDGILGLGLGGLSCSTTFNFLESLMAARPLLKPQFGMSFGRQTGEFHIGGYDPEALAGPLRWFPVHSPEEGFWQVPILAVRVGGVVVDSCSKGCHAIVDTGSSRVGVQKSHLPSLQTALASALHDEKGACRGPDLSFDLGGLEVVLGADDYTNGQSCEPYLGSLELEEPEYHGVYTFGEMVLRHYFVVFDWKDKMMGFAPADGFELEKNRKQFNAETTFV